MACSVEAIRGTIHLLGNGVLMIQNGGGLAIKIETRVFMPM